MPQRGEQLAAAILRQVPGAEREHIIAHSMGGLDARHAIAHVPGLAGRVATLVTIGTPHRGSPVADAIAGDVGTGLITPEQATCITSAYSASGAPSSFTIKVVGGKDGLLAGGVTNHEILMNGKGIDHAFVAYGDAIFGSYAACGVEF